MLTFIFEYVLPIISFGMAIMLFVKFWPMRDAPVKDMIKMFKQVNSWWGKSQGIKSGESRANTKDYKAATVKVGARIKAMMPFGLLDELTDDEVHAYIMHEDTIKVALKLKELFGGEWKLPGMPQLPGSKPRRRYQDAVPSMSK